MGPAFQAVLTESEAAILAYFLLKTSAVGAVH